MADPLSTGNKVATTVTTLLNVRRGTTQNHIYIRPFDATILSRMDSNHASSNRL